MNMLPFGISPCYFSPEEFNTTLWQTGLLQPSHINLGRRLGQWWCSCFWRPQFKSWQFAHFLLLWSHSDGSTSAYFDLQHLRGKITQHSSLAPPREPATSALALQPCWRMGPWAMSQTCRYTCWGVGDALWRNEMRLGRCYVTITQDRRSSALVSSTWRRHCGSTCTKEKSFTTRHIIYQTKALWVN